MINSKQLYNRDGARRLRERVISNEDERGQRLSGALFNQFNELHTLDFFDNKKVEEVLYRQKENDLKMLDDYKNLPKGQVHFSPSGSGKSLREHFFKSVKAKKDVVVKYPYQRRWTRNSSAVHEAIQRDLLYMESLLPEAKLLPHFLESGLPAWESNIKTYKTFTHKGHTFGLYGMMDGILKYTPDNSLIGFEFKTKSTIGAVGNYKMKDIGEDHKLQCVAYSLLFGINEFIVMYESVAKDGWLKGAEAKQDIRTFYYKVTEEERTALLDRFALACQYIEEGVVPPKEEDKDFFSPYKEIGEAIDKGELHYDNTINGFIS